VWKVEFDHPFNGGILATAGNLVFEGTADGRFIAFSADKGTKLWEAPARTGIIAPPMTYAINGEQYVTVMAGWGGALGLVGGAIAKAAEFVDKSRIDLQARCKEVLPPAPPEPVLPELLSDD
jgi:quinohemoprotein ethanol dehydrogenase